MDKTIVLISIKLFLSILSAWGQSGTEIFPHGARSKGMGNAHVTLMDGWSVFNNIGAIGRVEQDQALFSYDHRFGLNELTTLAAGAVLSQQFGSLGFGISHFGGQHFNQQNIGLGFSNTLGIGSFGVKLNYFQTNIEGMGRSGQAVLEVGGVTELTPELFFGIHIYNPTRSRISKNAPDHLPTIIQTGLSYRPISNLMFNIDARKDILLPAQINAGLEFNLLERFWARLGVQSHPTNLFLGMGFRPGRFHLDYAMGQNQRLGTTHHFSFNYLFLKP